MISRFSATILWIEWSSNLLDRARSRNSAVPRPPQQSTALSLCTFHHLVFPSLNSFCFSSLLFTTHISFPEMKLRQGNFKPVFFDPVHSASRRYDALALPHQHEELFTTIDYSRNLITRVKIDHRTYSEKVGQLFQATFMTWQNIVGTCNIHEKHLTFATTLDK